MHPECLPNTCVLYPSLWPAPLPLSDFSTWNSLKCLLIYVSHASSPIPHLGWRTQCLIPLPSRHRRHHPHVSLSISLSAEARLTKLDLLNPPSHLCHTSSLHLLLNYCCLLLTGPFQSHASPILPPQCHQSSLSKIKSQPCHTPTGSSLPYHRLFYY